MKEAFFGDASQGLPPIWRGFLLNVEVLLVAQVFILHPRAPDRRDPGQIPGPVFFPFRMLAIAFTDLFRGPRCPRTYIFGFGIPALALGSLSSQSVTVYGTAALVLSYSAYVSEVYRAGIESVHPSQVAAARSLGLSRWQALRVVVLPQRSRRVIPPLLNDFVSCRKTRRS